MVWSGTWISVLYEGFEMRLFTMLKHENVLRQSIYFQHQILNNNRLRFSDRDML